MIDVRGFNGGYNLDTALEMLPQGSYISALNVSVGPEGVGKLLGNQPIQSIPDTPDGENWVCGSCLDKTRQKIYYFVFNSEGYHRIVSVEVNALIPESSLSTILFEDRTDTGGSSILGWSDGETSFTPNKMIKDIKIIHRGNGEEGDLVYFIDPLKRPLKFNTLTLPALAASGDVILDYFKVIKAPPAIQPICLYIDAPGRNINNLRKKLFQFKSRFVYDDDEKSVWGAISKIPLPPKADDGSYYADGTKSNAITVSIPTGSKIVKKIEVAARVNVNSVWSNFFLVQTIDKQDNSISNNSLYNYTFFNDGAYLPLETEESNLLFDYVPDKANALELANGNTLVYGGIEEGLAKEVDLDVTIEKNAIDAVSSGFIIVNAYEFQSTEWYADFSGVVVADDQISITVNTIEISTGTPQSTTVIYTILSGDDITDVVNGLVALLNSTVYFTATAPSSSQIQFNASSGYFFDSAIGVTSIFTSGATSLDTDSIPALKWKGRYKYGIEYYSHDGKTNGVYISKDDSLTVDIDEYDESGSLPVITEVQLSISNPPPSWAEYFHIVRTKELTSSFSKFYVTKGVDITTDVNYPLINIENLVLHGTAFPASSSIINYTSTSFVKGDRIRFIKNVTTSTILTNQNDYEILGVVSVGGQQYIKIKSVSGLPTLTGNPKFLIEIFRPAPVISDDTTNFYYEIGERYPIYTDSNGNRAHSGLSQNQIIGTGAQPAIIQTSVGDYYAKKRTLVTGAAATDTTLYSCMDAHFSDFWESAVWGQGRALVIDESAKKQYFPALLRFSQSYIQGTNINNLNRFYPENFEEADNSFGDILRLKTRENFIRMFQRYKVGMIPIYRSIIVDTVNSTQVGISEKLLNQPNYYAGEYGIDKYGSSLVSSDYGDYFIDSINKAIVRVSLDGMTNISDTYNMAFFANLYINETSYGYGYFDYERRSVVMFIGDEFTKNIISYREANKVFESLHGYTNATSFQFVNGFLWSFYVQPYVHNSGTRNSFYGLQQGCSITPVFNGNVQLKKTYTAIEQMSTERWNVIVVTGPIREQITSLDSSDFTKTIPGFEYFDKENKYNATIKRDINTPGGKYFGDTMKGLFAKVTLTNNTGVNSRLISVSLKYIQSPLTNS